LRLEARSEKEKGGGKRRTLFSPGKKIELRPTPKGRKCRTLVTHKKEEGERKRHLLRGKKGEQMTGATLGPTTKGMKRHLTKGRLSSFSCSREKSPLDDLPSLRHLSSIHPKGKEKRRTALSF